MRYLVDGYNVAHALFGPASRQASAEELREAVIRRLARFGTRRRHVTVVFDGAGAPGAGEMRAGGTVEVRFARSADEEIVRLVRQAGPRAGDLCVVSRDREVTGRVRQLGARIVRVIDFLEQLETAAGDEVEPGEPPEKYEG